LFNSWKQLDAKAQAFDHIPSSKPVTLTISLSSGFGVPPEFPHAGEATHTGADIMGPPGTPVYATADGVIGRIGWFEGYGNLVEIEHGGSIQTRYALLSSIIAIRGSRVKRGQLIGLMGAIGDANSGRLHYELRLEGRSVNPAPFLRADGFLLK
jgi:murein DD-endopeptidase MepM/ murein hydrolase activator NlpD